VYCDGENYEGARPCHYEWVIDLHDACREADVNFVFSGTGYVFVKDGRTWHMSGSVTREQAAKAGLNVKGRPLQFHLKP
jgi:protein gp37